MLVLSRREGESITIILEDDRKITVTVCPGSRGGQLKIGVDAPEEVSILRSELDEHNYFLPIEGDY